MEVDVPLRSFFHAGQLNRLIIGGVEFNQFEDASRTSPVVWKPAYDWKVIWSNLEALGEARPLSWCVGFPFTHQKVDLIEEDCAQVRGHSQPVRELSPDRQVIDG